MNRPQVLVSLTLQMDDDYRTRLPLPTPMFPTADRIAEDVAVRLVDGPYSIVGVSVVRKP